MKTCPTCQSTYPDDYSLCPRDGAPLTAQATETEAQLAAGLSRRYRIIRQLGKGGMGTVFLAEQIGVGNRPVALKVLNRKLLDDPDFLLRFQNEAGSTGRIHHPNVVTIFESGQGEDGTPYIAMEFLEGESLREVLKQRGALPVNEVAEILQQTTKGLNAAHKLGIIHRDLKPDNIFLTHNDEGELIVKVVDFGIAKLRESSSHTMTGTVLGTPAYMSLEQASGMRSDELDARSDIYSLGVVVYEMLTGRLPFHSDTPVGYLHMHMHEEPPPFRDIASGLNIPPAVESAVMKALAKDRSQRHASVLAFATELVSAAQPLEVRQSLPTTIIVQPSKLPSPAGMVGPRVNPKDGLTYVWIPPGTLMMGSSQGDPEASDDEKPPHLVTISNGFWLAQTEVTVGGYKRFARSTGRIMPPDPHSNRAWSNDRMPIVNIVWEDAQAYSIWAGGRLPSEAEWEYAARGGSTGARYGSLDDVAWHTSNSLGQTCEVGQKRANGFGLYDMLGNVWEWVNDWYDDAYYRHSPSQDPKGPVSGMNRVLRGGSWGDGSRLIRVSYRCKGNPADRSYVIGFRCGGEVFVP